MNRVQQFFTGIALLSIALLVLAGLPALAQNDSVARLIGGIATSLREPIVRPEGSLTTDPDLGVTLQIAPCRTGCASSCRCQTVR